MRQVVLLRPLNTQKFIFIITLILLAILFIFKSCQVAQFHRDAQYYIQSSVLWPKGLVTFAGSLIGGRDLVVFFYHFFMKSFGYSVDTLSLALAITYFFSGLFLVTIIFRFNISNLMRLWISTFVLLISYALPIWSYPASDNLGALALVGLWLLYIISVQTQKKWLIFFVYPICVGIAYHVRTELILFGLLTFIGIVFQFKRASYLQRLALFLIILFSTQLGVFVIEKSWMLWVPAKKPYVYKGIFLSFRAFHFASGRNGPNSSKLSHLLHLRSDEKIPFWDALGSTYSKIGAAKSDELISKAGFEALYQNPLSFLKEITHIQSETFKLEISIPSWSEQEKTQKRDLNDLDLVRKETQMKFGGDAIFPLAKLLISSDSLIHDMRAFLPPIKVEMTVPFSYQFVFPICLLILLVKVDKLIRTLLLPPVIYALVLFFLINFTEGPVVRYLNGIMLLEWIVLWIALNMIFVKNSRVKVNFYLSNTMKSVFYKEDKIA
ncbi:hypothetical protein [Legionella cherrii]|uniref:Glycosyltransferase RgtA/B/C/D-like domain-containing protein n=1 Tax=Legionella cherrii TaxID=28084 RepID=A0ABY6T3W3_9GAMM|nr:hypothetical protein [Legionella cherrii]VEB34445.1 Uncharacterised protein [Legionella cherrii]